MTLVEIELPCISSIRAPAIDDLLSMKQMRADTLRMIIVDELLLENLTEALLQLRAVFPTTCLALAYRRPEIARKLLNELQLNPSWGKVGFLPMNTNLDCWLSILRLLASGECYVPVELFANAPPTPPTQNPLSIGEASKNAEDIHLTDRELQVLESAAAGKQNKIIADDLKLSQHTVKLHMHHIIAKLGVNNRTEAANWFHGRKLGF
jgi:DNA-binding NarL/FixJ family response regulator